MKAHWTARYLGQPYVEGGCWHLFRQVQREQFDREVREVPAPEKLAEIVRAFRDRTDSFGWVKVARPVEGAAVLMSAAMHPHHVGTYVADVRGGSVLHAVKGVGVALPPLSHIEALRWRIVGYYVPAADPLASTQTTQRAA